MAQALVALLINCLKSVDNDKKKIRANLSHKFPLIALYSRILKKLSKKIAVILKL
jgi:hypothetical protein